MLKKVWRSRWGNLEVETSRETWVEVLPQFAARNDKLSEQPQSTGKDEAGMVLLELC